MDLNELNEPAIQSSKDKGGRIMGIIVMPHLGTELELLVWNGILKKKNWRRAKINF